MGAIPEQYGGDSGVKLLLGNLHYYESLPIPRNLKKILAMGKVDIHIYLKLSNTLDFNLDFAAVFVKKVLYTNA